MNQTLTTICNQLDQIALSLASGGNPGAVSVGNNNWTFPGISRDELALRAQSLSDLIKGKGQEELGDNAALIQDYTSRLTLTQTAAQNFWSQPATTIPSLLITFEGLKEAVSTALASDYDTTAGMSRAARQLRSLEARLRSSLNSSANVDEMLDRIRQAYDAAERLPVDLDSLTDAQAKVDQIKLEIEKNRASASLALDEIDEGRTNLGKILEESNSVLSHCQSAYSASTSVGLAAAFSERSKALERSTWFWVGGLVLALLLGGFFGSRRIERLAELLSDGSRLDKPVTLNILIAILSISTPIWFGWLATKQVGQRFRLAEDYAFKAAVSRAYEGYRREAARIDSDLEAKLLASALTRLDEQPLRLVEGASYGSPWHELASSETFKEALRLVPGFAGQALDFARDAVSRVPSRKVSRSHKADSSDV